MRADIQAPFGTNPAQVPDVEVLITAGEAYPRFEALMLGAQKDVVMGFRIFDPETPLLSEAARAVGKTWADLLLHTANRGVEIRLTLADFDPIVGNSLHEMAWRATAALNALNQISGPQAARINVQCLLHPAKSGVFPRLLFALKMRKKLKEITRDITSSSDPEERLRHMPGLESFVSLNEGHVRMRTMALPCPRPVTLHHKLAVFDGKVAYIGGLDLNERRFDDAEHNTAAQSTWHDVQVVTHDEQIATAARDHLLSLSATIDRKATPVPWHGPFLTTLSRRRASNLWRLAPETISTGMLDTHLEQITRAQQFIYLETQYFRDSRIAKALAKAAHRNKDLRLIILLPAAPEEALIDKKPGIETRFGEYLQVRALRIVRRAFGSRFLAVSPVQPRRPEARDTPLKRATLKGAPVIYVHSKLAIFDDHAAIVSSANLNGRSMKWDAEAGLLLDNTAQVRMLTKRVFNGWLGDEIDCAPAGAFNRWTTRAYHNTQRPPEARTGFIVPYDLGAAKEAGTPLPGAPEELV